jgi:hypothetical protein
MPARLLAFQAGTPKNQAIIRFVINSGLLNKLQLDSLEARESIQEIAQVDCPGAAGGIVLRCGLPI